MITHKYINENEIIYKRDDSGYYEVKKGNPLYKDKWRFFIDEYNKYKEYNVDSEIKITNDIKKMVFFYKEYPNVVICYLTIYYGNGSMSRHA